MSHCIYVIMTDGGYLGKGSRIVGGFFTDEDHARLMLDAIADDHRKAGRWVEYRAGDVLMHLRSLEPHPILEDRCTVPGLLKVSDAFNSCQYWVQKIHHCVMDGELDLLSRWPKNYKKVA